MSVPETPDCSTLTAEDMLNENNFDSDNGTIFLIGGDECHATTLDTFNIKNGRVKIMREEWYEKKASNPSNKPTDLEQAQFDDLEKNSNKVTDYSDGYTVVSSWQFVTDEVGADDEAGVCHFQGDAAADNWATCWAVVRNSANSQWATEYSLLVPSNLLVGEYKLSTATTYHVTTALYDGVLGSWKISGIKHINNMDNITATRFLPSETYLSTNSVTNDPRFVAGDPLNVYTYMTARLAPAGGLYKTVQQAEYYQKFNIGEL